MLIATMIFALCACDFSGNGSGSDTSGTNGTNNASNKTFFSETVANYDNQTVGRSDITAQSGFTVYAMEKNVAVPYRIGVQTDISRIKNGKSAYAEITANPWNVDDSAIEIVALAYNYIKNADGMQKLSADAQKEINGLTQYLDYIHGFLLGEINAEAKLGISADGTYNLKANYDYDKAGGEDEKNSVWCCADDETLRELLNADGLSVVVGSYLTASFYDNLTAESAVYGYDSAPMKTDSSGNATYDISLRNDVIADAVLGKLLKFAGAASEAIEKNKEVYNSFLDTIEGWITVENADVKASADANKLPTDIITSVNVSVEIDCEELSSILSTLYSKGILDNTATEVSRFILYILDDKLCGANGKTDGKIGLEMTLDMNENFSYSASECSLGGLDSDLFLSADAEADGRVSAAELLEKTVEVPAVFIAEQLAAVQDANTVKEIENKVNEAINSLPDGTHLTEKTLETVLLGVLKNYSVNNAEIEAALKGIVSALEEKLGVGDE
jgi:hypothetical protein